MRRVLLPLVIAALLGAPSARAQSTGGPSSPQPPQGADAAAAQALFDEARHLMVAGKLTLACPKLLASLKLDVKPGTALNLAACYEQSGQIASAWARYLETESLAQRAGQLERERYAKEHATSLELRLSRLTITAATATPGLEVLRDGAPVDAATLGTAVPIDPGKHLVEARAPGRRSWSQTVEITADATRLTVEVPALEAPALRPVDPDPAPAPRSPQDTRPRAPRVLTYAAFAVGGAGIVTGAVTGGLALAKAAAVAHACQGTSCPVGTDSDLSTGRTLGSVSTVAFVFGGASAAAGVIGLVLNRPRPGPRPSAAVHPWIGPASVGLGGEF